MQTYKVVSAAKISASVEDIYRVLSDYHNQHLRILPPEHFVELKLENGGQGAGTVLSFKVKVFGNIIPFRMEVSEPEPGRVLLEKDLLSEVFTTFSLNPLNKNQTKVEIATTLPIKGGLAGFMEKLINPSLLKGIYRKELRLQATHLSADIVLE